MEGKRPPGNGDLPAGSDRLSTYDDMIDKERVTTQDDEVVPETSRDQRHIETVDIIPTDHGEEMTTVETSEGKTIEGVSLRRFKPDEVKALKDYHEMRAAGRKAKRDFVAGINPDSQKFQTILQTVEGLVSRNSVGELVNLMRSGTEIHPTALLRLLEKYMSENIGPTDNLIKVVTALTDVDYLKYGIKELLKDREVENLARYYSVIREAELILQNKTANEILVMITEEQLDESVLIHLLREYETGRLAPNGIKEELEKVVSARELKI